MGFHSNILYMHIGMLYVCVLLLLLFTVFETGFHVVQPGLRLAM